MAKTGEPVQEAVKAYFELALGLTEASRKKAEKTVRRVTQEVLGKGGATAAQIQGLAEDAIASSNANREAIASMVRVELERALGRLGLVRAEELAVLNGRVEELERRLVEATAAAESAAVTATVAQATAVRAAQESAAAAEEAAVAEEAALAASAPAKKTVAKKTAVKKAPAKKTVAKKTAAKKAPAKDVSEPTHRSSARSTRSQRTEGRS